ncbi:Lrp/AsnC family transcriptional regulator, partial [archaeon]|nr:Lrp/AsnC family transcriptional regulator [archaeon]
RFPYSAIAKIVKLSSKTVQKKVESLKKQKVIDKFYITVYRSMVGFLRYTHMFLKVEEDKEVFSKLCELPEIITMTTYSGNYNLLLSLSCSTIDHHNETVNKIKEILGDKLKNYEVFFISKSRYLKRAYFVDKELDIERLNPAGSFQKIILQHKQTFPKTFLKLDDLDLNILEELRINARIPLLDLAKKVNSNRKTVESRINNLIKIGLVGHFTTHVNYEALGYSKVQLLLQLKQDSKTKELIEHLKQNKNAHGYYEYTGKWNVRIEFILSKVNEIFEIINEAKQLYPEIIQDNSVLVSTKEYKFEPFQTGIKQIYKSTKKLIGLS